MINDIVWAQIKMDQAGVNEQGSDFFANRVQLLFSLIKSTHLTCAYIVNIK